IRRGPCDHGSLQGPGRHDSRENHGCQAWRSGRPEGNRGGAQARYARSHQEGTGGRQGPEDPSGGQVVINLRIGSFVMINVRRGLSILPLAAILVLGVLSQGCALKPKPSELEALEKLRASPSAAAALKLKNAAPLVKSSDELLTRSQAKWKSSDLDESTDAALMGQAKLKHAIALADQEAAKARIAKAEDDLDDLAEEQAKVQKDLDAVNEAIGLLHQTAQAKEEQKAMEAQMDADRKMAADKSDTADKISAAELALKTADTVQASTYAKAEYSAASDTLARAQAELQQGNFRGAQMSADIARKKAEDATAIAGVEVRRDARGVLQRIVLSIPAEQLFTKKQSVIAPGREAMLDPIA